MLRRPQMTLVLGLFLAAAVLPARAADDPAKALDGDWLVTKLMHDGKEDPMPADAPKMILTIKGQSITAKIGDETHTGTIKLDPSKSPKTIDFTPDDGPDKGKTMQGIYDMKDDEARICHGEPGTDRPKDFGSKEGSGITMVTLKRVKK